MKQEYIYLLEEINDNLRKQLEFVREIPSNGSGAVYVLRQAGTSNYKIGCTSNYTQRKARFDIRLPFDVEEVLVFKTPKYRQVEAEAHEHFSQKRLNGSEFFELSDEEIDSLSELFRSFEEKRIVSEPIDEEDTDDDKDAEFIEKAKALATSLDIKPIELSISLIQRKLSLGYARAARIKDRLVEEAAEENPSEEGL